MKKIFLAITLLSMVLVSCKEEEYDGLFNVDEEPETGVVFPDSEVNGIPVMDDNAFIIKQNSVANGKVDVRIKNKFGKQIVSIEPRAQRFRGTVAWPNLSPSVPSSSTQRAPATFNRTITSLGVTQVSPASEVTYSLDIAALPALLRNAALTAVTPPTGTTPAYEVFRFFLLVTYSDGTSVISNEVRVVVTG